MVDEMHIVWHIMFDKRLNGSTHFFSTDVELSHENNRRDHTS
jgi:hypothetical protein